MKIKNVIKFLFKLIIEILKILFKVFLLFPLYCMGPAKYSGESFEDWLKNNKEK